MKNPHTFRTQTAAFLCVFATLFVSLALIQRAINVYEDVTSTLPVCK